MRGGRSAARHAPRLPAHLFDHLALGADDAAPKLGDRRVGRVHALGALCDLAHLLRELIRPASRRRRRRRLGLRLRVDRRRRRRCRPRIRGDCDRRGCGRRCGRGRALHLLVRFLNRRDGAGLHRRAAFLRDRRGALVRRRRRRRLHSALRTKKKKSAQLIDGARRHRDRRRILSAIRTRLAQTRALACAPW